MLPPRTTITASSGLSLDGLPKVLPVKGGAPALGASIGIVGVTGWLSTLVSVVVGCLMDGSWPTTV